MARLREEVSRVTGVWHPDDESHIIGNHLNEEFKRGLEPIIPCVSVEEDQV